MLDLLTSNLLGILIATFATAVINSIWYSKAVFGKDWQKLTGLKDKEIKSRENKVILITLLVAFITSIVVQRFIVIANPQNYFEAIKLATWLWLGFAVTHTVGGGVLEKRPAKLIIINAIYQLVAILVVMVVLFASK